MNIAILGSTGFVGLNLLKKALENGYKVKTLVRNPNKLGDYKNSVEYVSGNVTEVDKLEQTIKGVDAVISTLPPTGANNDPDKSAEIMKYLVTTLEKNKVKRFIHIGGAAHGGGSNESWKFNRRFLRAYLNLVCKPVLEAKQLEWDILRNSNLKWTLVRPPRVMKDKPVGRLVADEKDIYTVQVNVADLADFLLDQTKSDKWIEKAPLVSTVSS